MECRFELRHKGVTLRSDVGTFFDNESVIEYAVELALKSGIPNSRVWVLNEANVILILGVRSAAAIRRSGSDIRMKDSLTVANPSIAHYDFRSNTRNAANGGRRASAQQQPRIQALRAEVDAD